MSEAFDAFVAQAWADHAEQPQAVAERLRSAAPATPAELAALVRLTVHLLGEHLGRFDEARARLDALCPQAATDGEARSALRVGLATLNLAEGRAEPMDGFGAGEKVRAEAAAAAVCIGRGDSARGAALLRAARQRLATLPDAQAADHRPLAVACHNLAWVLIERGASRSAEDTAAMLDAAAGSREHWSHAGSWLEVERADYDLARAHLAAGSHDTALRHAGQCLEACVAHEAPPFEHFFAHEALALVQQARGDAAAARRHVQAAQAAFERLGPDDQAACRAALDTLLAPP